MSSQDRGWRQRADLARETFLDCLRLPGFRHNCDDLLRFKNLPNRHRNRPPRNLIQTFKPTLSHLLPPTGLIKVHYDVRLVSLKVGRRIVESQMPILPNTNKRKINWRFPYLRS